MLDYLLVRGEPDPKLAFLKLFGFLLSTYSSTRCRCPTRLTSSFPNDGACSGYTSFFQGTLSDPEMRLTSPPGTMSRDTAIAACKLLWYRWCLVPSQILLNADAGQMHAVTICAHSIAISVRAVLIPRIGVDVDFGLKATLFHALTFRFGDGHRGNARSYLYPSFNTGRSCSLQATQALPSGRRRRYFIITHSSSLPPSLLLSTHALSH